MTLTRKPYSESCDQNRKPILVVIEPLLAGCSRVLEIGSGTGQHAVYFAAGMPHLHWQCSDRADCIDGINLWREEAALNNLPPPLVLDVTDSRWPQLSVDAVFTANTLHIMHRQEVERFFPGVDRVLAPGGGLLIYGPFNYGGAYTSASNERFDHWLKARDPHSGIKDFEWLLELAASSHLQLVNDYVMPANNRILHFTKKP